MDDIAPESDPLRWNEWLQLPFAGRESALAFLQQQLANPANLQAITFLGRRRIGKTMLLQHLAKGIHPTFLGVYVPLQHTPLHDDDAWVYALAQITINAVKAQGYVVGELVQPEETTALRDWFSEIGLPALFRAIRPSHRRLILLLDDLHLLDQPATAAGTLPNRPNLLVYLHSLLHAQLGIVATLDLIYENRLERFYPLVNPSRLHRLTQLSPTAAAEVFTNTIGGNCQATDAALAAIYRQTGGEPALLQRFRFYLQELGKETVTPAEIKAAIPMVYTACAEELDLLWNLLNRNEQQVLLAIGNLRYDDPLRPVDTDAIAGWLIKSDQQADTITINAAIRSLEYYGLVEGGAADAKIAAGLLHKWLLEKAGIDSGQDQVTTGTFDNWQLWLIGILLIAAITLLTIIGLADLTEGIAANTPVPTVPIPTP